MMINSQEYAREVDRLDELSSFRDRFFIPQKEGKDCVYFTGNSLGLQPKSTINYIQQELDDWAALGVEGHFHAKRPWKKYHEFFSRQIAMIVGSLPDEVVVMNQLSVNLHLLMVSFYRPTKERFRIICEGKAFPSDQYAMETQVQFHGYNPEDAIIEVFPREGEHTIRTDDILSTLQRYKDSTALVLFGGVNYYTGQLFNIPAITKAAHEIGAIAGFDLAHAIGNVELKLHEWNVDFATWCSYKYLNSGPGGASGIFIHQKHISNTKLPRFAGWWGHNKETRFQMQKGFDPMTTAEGWQLSNAPVLSLAPQKASLDIFEEAGLEAVYLKGKKLAAYLHFVLDTINQSKSKKTMEVITPADEQQHGCQVSILMLEKGKEVFAALTNAGVIADWREPNVIRVAPVPFYNSFENIWTFGNIINSILD